MTQALPKRLGQGYYWQDIEVGQVFETFRRTVTETDLVNFISTTGMLEAIFIEAGYEGGAIQGRPVPAALTYALIEGFILQTMIQGTGLAMLELTQKIHGPVVVGDTIRATVIRDRHPPDVEERPRGGGFEHRGLQPAQRAGDDPPRRLLAGR